MLLAVLAALALSHAVAGLGDGLLSVAPALALMVVLLGRRYPGEHLLHRLREARLVRSHRSPAAPMRPRLPWRAAPRGGLLLAVSRAGRAPPRVAGWR